MRPSSFVQRSSTPCGVSRMAEHLPYYGHEQGCYNSKIPWGPEPCSGCVSLRRAFSQGQRDEREACIAAVSAPTLHDDACCSNGCTLMHSSEWEATRRIQIALGLPLSEEPPPPYRCDGSCNCTAAAFIAAIRAREEKP